MSVSVPAAKSFDGLMQLCMQKYIASRQRGVHLYPPYPPWIRHHVYTVCMIVNGSCAL